MLVGIKDWGNLLAPVRVATGDDYELFQFRRPGKASCSYGLLCGKEMMVRTFIVENDLPLLLSRQTMMNMGMVIDLNRMVVSVRDSNENENIQMTNSGHVTVLIRKERSECNNSVVLQSYKPQSEHEVEEEPMIQQNTENASCEPLKTRGDKDSTILEPMETAYQDCSLVLTTGYPWEVFNMRTSADVQEISDTSRKKMQHNKAELQESWKPMRLSRSFGSMLADCPTKRGANSDKLCAAQQWRVAD